jgi:DNA (cytosine-5)-methyltransferase 1
MTARVQGWRSDDAWLFAGRKTSQYRQIGNAFPPPVAHAIGERIAAALRHEGEARLDSVQSVDLHDPVYKALASSPVPLTFEDLVRAHNESGSEVVEQRLAALKQDFELEMIDGSDGVRRYRLGSFKGFTGQDQHSRHDFFAQHRNRVS